MKNLVAAIPFLGSADQVMKQANDFLASHKNHPIIAIIFRGDSQSIFEQTAEWCKSLGKDTPRDILEAHQQSRTIMFGILNMPPESCEKISITSDGDIIHLTIKIYQYE